MYHCFLYHVLENVWNTSGDAIACWTSTLVTESKHTSVVWCRCRLVKVDIQSLWGTFRTLTSLCATLTTLADRLSAFERLCRTLSALAGAYKHWKFGKRTECLTAFARCRRKLMEMSPNFGLWDDNYPAKCLLAFVWLCRTLTAKAGAQPALKSVLGDILRLLNVHQLSQEFAALR